jgi:Lrp/AsnC family transcriptional regulator for asnA, asnC and gidA
MVKEADKLLNRKAIDQIDAKILKILLKESRTSFTKIAENCAISVGAVRKRYKRLWKEGIINGEIMQVDPRSLGYKCIANIGVTTAREDEDEVIKFLRKKPFSRVVFQNAFERTNIAVIVSLHEFEELAKAMREIEANPLIKNSNAYVWSKTFDLDYPENLILTTSNNESEREKSPKKNNTNFEKTKIDKEDRQIAKILSQHSRTPFIKIAKELEISTKKVIERYKKLRGTVLASSTITINLSKLGYNALAHLLIKSSNKSKIPEIQADLLKIPNLITVMEIFGDYELFPIIALSNYEELFRLKEQINTIGYIDQMDMILAKPYYAWPIDLFSSLL